MQNAKHTLAIMMASLFAILTLTASAGAAIRFEVSSGEDGFMLDYNIPVVGFGKINLSDPGDSDNINIALGVLRLAQVELGLNEIEPAAVSLHYAVSSAFLPPGGLPEGDISVPFGGLGAIIDLFGKRMRKIGDNQIEAAFLLGNNKSEYEIAVNIEGTLEGEWSGEADADNNVINEVIENPDGSVLADIELELNYSLPLFTGIIYDITINVPGGDVEGLEGGGLEIPPIQGGPIPLPNGSYHIWFNPPEGALDGGGGM